MTLSKFTVTSNLDPNVMPKGGIWCFIGLPKRGKTHNSARFNPSSDRSKTLYIDLENTILRFPQHSGTKVLPTAYYLPPKRDKLDAAGKKILNSKNVPEQEIVPLTQRGYCINGEDKPLFSIREVVTILKAASANGELKEYESIVIDTVDVLQDLIEAHVINEYNKEMKSVQGRLARGLGEIGERGTGWDNAKKLLLEILNDIYQIAQRHQLELIFLIHSKTTTQLPDGKSQRDPAIRPSTSLTLFGMVDIIGYVDRVSTHKSDGDDDYTVANGLQYTVNFKTYSEELTGGSRFEHLVNKIVPFSYKEIKKEYEQSIKTNKEGESNE